MCSKAVSNLCNGMCSSSWSMGAVMLDFKQDKEADDKCVDWTSGQTQFSLTVSISKYCFQVL